MNIMMKLMNKKLQRIQNQTINNNKKLQRIQNQTINNNKKLIYF